MLQILPHKLIQQGLLSGQDLTSKLEERKESFQSSVIPGSSSWLNCNLLQTPQSLANSDPVFFGSPLDAFKAYFTHFFRTLRRLARSAGFWDVWAYAHTGKQREAKRRQLIRVKVLRSLRLLVRPLARECMHTKLSIK